MAVHPAVSVNAASTPHLSLRDDLALWGRLGVTHVGLHRRKLAEVGWERAIAMVRDAGFAVTTVVHSDMFDLSRPKTWARSSAELIAAIDAASAVGARSVYGTTGRFGGLTWEEAADAFINAVEPAREHARDRGVLLGIEVTSIHLDHNFVHDLDEGRMLAERAGVAICLDTFWSARERELRGRIGRVVPHLCLVQVADAPRDSVSLRERVVPGDGVLPIARVIAWSLEAGYPGPFEIEVMGSGPEGEGIELAMGRSVAWLSDLLNELKA